ncbi:DUF4156 domain-containing protein [Francisellaceae bacterium]|nr:DUF4156 domain-containing protein [Francisellaceae bacterium]
MIKYAIPLAILSLTIASCTMVPPNSLNKPEYNNIRVTNLSPPKNCKYLGEVYGSQGNWFSGIFTANVYLVMGAMNDLRNNAAEMGANYVFIDHLKYMGPGFINGSNYSTYVAQAFSCKGQDKPLPNQIKQKECGWFSFCLYDGSTTRVNAEQQVVPDQIHDYNSN